MSTRGHHGLLLGSMVAGFPTYLGATTSGFSTASTSHNVAMPASVSSGDLLIIQLGTGQTGANTITTPSGWTLLHSGAPGSFRVVTFYKVASGTEGGTTVAVAMTTSLRASAIVHRIQVGTFSSSPEISAVNGTGTTPDPPNLSPTWGSANTLWIASFASINNGAISAYPFPNNNVTVSDGGAGGTGASRMGSCTSEQTVSSLNPGSFTKSGSVGWWAMTVGVRPV